MDTTHLLLSIVIALQVYGIFIIPYRNMLGFKKTLEKWRDGKTSINYNPPPFRDTLPSNLKSDRSKLSH